MAGQSSQAWLMPIVQLALETAMRRGELLELKWEHVNLARRVAYLPMTKNGESRTVLQTRIRNDNHRFLSLEIRPRTILKDDEKHPVVIKRLPGEIKRGEELLKRYQAILDRTEILNPVTGQLVQPYDMFQYRVFSRNSFDFNGRVFGGFWQNCKKHYRGQITLDGMPTVEIDFKGSFPVILYHFLGIDIWRQYENLQPNEIYKADPYYLPGYTDQQPYGEDFRPGLDS